MPENINQSTTPDAPKIVQTDLGASDGQTKCPKCGATEISTNTKTGNLRCHYCRYEFFASKVVGLESDISKLNGVVMGSGTQDIVADTKDVLTFKCSSCGAEVVIDTNESTQSRCHWCRNTLSVNQQIPNGSIPDVVLPFKLSKDNAREEIEKFVGKRKFFAHPKFKQEFTTENIMGVYFPYMVVDINGHSNLSGEGEKLIRRYTRGSNDNKETYYDADAYEVEREFDIVIEGLTVESSSDKLNKKATDKTTNVINAIMPFDIENCVKWDSNYLKGYTSERRDTNVEGLKELVETQSKDVARFKANETLKEYDRGVAWANERLDIKGEQWKSAYLPVWLYSYQQIKGDKKLLHYVAVNARTKETMGSVPIHMPKLIIISILIELAGFILAILTATEDSEYNWLFLLSGIIFYFIIYFRYRNSNARHKHELETKTTMNNLVTRDNYIERRKGLRNAMIVGCNNTLVSGQDAASSILNTISNGKLPNNLLTKGLDGSLEESIKTNTKKIPKWLIIIPIIIVVVGILISIGMGIISSIINSSVNNLENNINEVIDDYGNVLDDYVNEYEDYQESTENFLMSVEDVFAITGRGTVVTGTIQRGKVKPGDEVQIIGLNDEIITTYVEDIEMFREFVDEATTGDNVGILLRNVTSEQIKRGQVIAKPNSILSTTKFEATIELNSDEISLISPITNGYPLQYFFRTLAINGTITLPIDKESIVAGDIATVTIELENNIAMEIGTEFSIRENGITIGEGTVTKIYE